MPGGLSFVRQVSKPSSKRPGAKGKPRAADLRPNSRGRKSTVTLTNEHVIPIITSVQRWMSNREECQRALCSARRMTCCSGDITLHNVLYDTSMALQGYRYDFICRVRGLSNSQRRMFPTLLPQSSLTDSMTASTRRTRSSAFRRLMSGWMFVSTRKILKRLFWLYICLAPLGALIVRACPFLAIRHASNTSPPLPKLPVGLCLRFHGSFCPG